MIVKLRMGLPKYKRYQTYKNPLRQDFKYTCGYCLMPERELGGRSTFAVEHYRPKELFPDLKLDYTNLRYACLLCNSHKGENWPTDEDHASGRYYLDPCATDVNLLYRFDSEGQVHGRSHAASYTIEQLNLNRRQLTEKRKEMVDNLSLLLNLSHDITVRQGQLEGDNSESAAEERARLSQRRDQAAMALRRLIYPEPID
jgi:uncharacterized protein (TIGR02646 family)